MVLRKLAVRRQSDARRSSLCRRCYVLLAVCTVLVPYHLWEQIASIASVVMKASVSNGGREEPASRHWGSHDDR
jgi:predicted membrane channel-forming protein YqfA (hemolysin III family)